MPISSVTLLTPKPADVDAAEWIIARLGVGAHRVVAIRRLSEVPLEVRALCDRAEAGGFDEIAVR